MQRTRVPRALVGVFASLGILGFVMAACSTHVEQPPEEPETPATPRSEEETDGFNQEELGQLDALLDGGVSAPGDAESEPAP